MTVVEVTIDSGPDPIVDGETWVLTAHTVGMSFAAPLENPYDFWPGWSLDKAEGVEYVWIAIFALSSSGRRAFGQEDRFADPS